MDLFPFDYVPIKPTTWTYLASFLLLALFFKFNRFWSVRNLDLVLIILLAPGLLMIIGGREWVQKNGGQLTQEQVQNKAGESNRDGEPSAIIPKVDRAGSGLPETLEQNQADQLNPSSEKESVRPPKPADEATEQDVEQRTESAKKSNDLKSPLKSGSLIEADANEKVTTDTKGHQWQRWGYYWLFVVGGILLLRLLFDQNLKRRPHLEPNLSIGGLVFLGCALMVFLFANVITSNPAMDDLKGAQNAVKMVQREAADDSGSEELLVRRGPGYALFSLLPIIPSFENGDAMLKADNNMGTNISRYVVAAKTLAVGSQLMIVLGLILFCTFNYNNFNVGVGTATIYLMLPYTAVYTGHALHVLPAALLVWSMVSFRRPMVAGILIGLATGVSYYPIFLLPLWISFYWERGKRRFIIGVLAAVLVCIAGLIFTSVDMKAFGSQLQTMFGFWQPIMEGLEGIWALGWNHWWRLPILVAFVLLCGSFAAWPTEKNIGTLVSYSAAVMIGVQFWHGFGGGLYMAWYLPLVLLAVFRPNLAGRVASNELVETKRVQKEKPEDLLPVA